MRVKDNGSRPAPASMRELFSRLVRGRSPAIKVERRVIPYWQERGWTRDGTRYTGSYRTANGSFYGYADEVRRGSFRFFVFQPPAQLEHHSHWSCFQNRGEGWFEVHMARQPRDVSSGVMSIERILHEAMEG